MQNYIVVQFVKIKCNAIHSGLTCDQYKIKKLDDEPKSIRRISKKLIKPEKNRDPERMHYLSVRIPTWNCSLCTHINSMERRNCAMCRAPRASIFEKMAFN